MISRVSNYSGRSLFIQFLFLFGFIILIIRLIYIQVFQDEFIKKQVDSRTILESSILAKRGKILDRNNRLLAVDVKGYTVIADLNLFKPTKSQISSLLPLLEIEANKIERILNKKRGHGEIIRHIEEE